MAVVVVATSGVTRVNDAEALGTQWTDLAGTAAVLEVEFFYQGSNSVSEKVKTTESGVKYFDGDISEDFTSPVKTAILKLLVTTPNNLNATAATSMIAEIGTLNRVNYYRYYIHTNVTYPPDRSWLFVPIDPNVVGYRDATVGSPTLTDVSYYALAATMQTSAAKSENVAMDAIDLVDAGGGLLLTGGDGASADGTMDDFLSFDQGTAGNRYGLCTSREGIFYVLAFLICGSATATVFTDNNRVLVFPDGRFDVGFCGTKWSLANAANVHTVTSFIFNGRGSAGGVTDTRPDHAVTGTAGTVAFNSCTFNVYRNITLTSGATLSACVLLGGLLVTQAGGTITGCDFSAATTATGVGHVLADNPSLITGCNFTQGAAGHAVRCDTVGTYTWAGNTDIGYTGTRGSNLVSSSGSTDAMFFNDSGGLITLNVSGGGQAPSVRNGAGATTQVNNNVSVTLTGMPDNTEVRVYTTGTQTERAGIENATAGSPGDRSFTFTLGASEFLDIVIHNVAYEHLRIQNFDMPATDSSIPIQLRFDRNKI